MRVIDNFLKRENNLYIKSTNFILLWLTSEQYDAKSFIAREVTSVPPMKLTTTNFLVAISFEQKASLISSLRRSKSSSPIVAIERNASSETIYEHVENKRHFS